LIDRLGIWQASPADSLFPEPTTAADIATTTVELFMARMEYVDLFTHLIMSTKPVNAPNADDLLGSVNDTGDRPPQPHPTEALYRRLFGLETLGQASFEDQTPPARSRLLSQCYPGDGRQPMVDFNDEFDDAVRRGAQPYEQRVDIPAGLTEDEAVASVIEQYKQSTGIELAEAVVRADVRAQMKGRDTTP
jgi:hypothetical protein